MECSLLSSLRSISRKRGKHPDTVCRFQFSDHEDTSPREKVSQCLIGLNCFCLDKNSGFSTVQNQNKKYIVVLVFFKVFSKDERAYNDLN